MIQYPYGIDGQFSKPFISGTLNSDIHVPESNKKIFADLVSDMKKALKKSSAIRETVHSASLLSFHSASVGPTELAQGKQLILTGAVSVG